MMPLNLSQCPSGKKLRSQLRGVMSDRVMRITRECSKQQLNPTPPSASKDANTSKFQRLTSSSFTHPPSDDKPSTPNPALSTPAPILTDKTSLVQHLRAIYQEVVDKDASPIATAKAIVESIGQYSRHNNLDLTETLESIIREHLTKTTVQVKQAHQNEPSEQMKSEGQLQVVLKIETFAATVTPGKPLDEDFVWELANWLRWLSQVFKQKFKIERFLFGELYASYQAGPAAELVHALMEELGYDKDDDSDDDEPSDKSSNPVLTATSPTAVANEETGKKSAPQPPPNEEFKTPVKRPPDHSLKENLYPGSQPGMCVRVTSLFEDVCVTQSQDFEATASCTVTFFVDELSQSGLGLGDERECVDLLDDFKKKKLHSRANSVSMNTSNMNRSIVVPKKQTKLKIRSPHKSPHNRKILTPQTASRKSPRIRDQQILLSDHNRKRPRSYLITDTPDEKQKSTRLTIRQEKIRKRFSISHKNSPVVPETPMKDEVYPNNEAINTHEPLKAINISSRYRELMFANQRSYSLSPRKNLVKG